MWVLEQGTRMGYNKYAQSGDFLVFFYINKEREGEERFFATKVTNLTQCPKLR